MSSRQIPIETGILTLRFFHEALAAPNPPGDPAGNFPVDKIPKNALSGIACAECL
jgi:hypothetical protein